MDDLITSGGFEGVLNFTTYRGYAYLDTYKGKSVIPVACHFLNGKFSVPKQSNNPSPYLFFKYRNRLLTLFVSILESAPSC